MGNSPTKLAPRPLKVIESNVSPITVGKYYLKVELNKLFKAEELRAGIDKTIDELEEHTFWRLLEAMSFTLRLNGIFWAVSNDKYTWSEEEWSAENITFVQMRPSIDKITFSPKIGGNPLKFRDYLKEYFTDHPGDDPENLDQFRPDPNRQIPYSKLFLVEEGEKIRLIDGGNRLIANLMRGQDKITAYTARATNLEGKYRIGDSTFWLLGRMLNQANPEDKDAVLKTMKILINNSLDGKNATQTCWINNIPEPELRNKYKDLLNTEN